LALGDIVQVLDTQGFALQSGNALVLCKRNKNIAVLLSQDIAANTPLARAISINDAGTINATPTGSLSLYAGAGRDLGLIHWYENIFVAMVNDHTAANRLISFSVSDAGVIPGAIIDDLSLAAASNLHHISDLLQIHDTVIVTGSTYPAAADSVETAIVSIAGSFSAGLADKLPLATRPREQRLRQGSGTRIVEAYTSANVINIVTFTCTALGLMPATPDDSWAWFTAGAERVSLCKITDLVYAIFTYDSDGEARIRTFSINLDGSINKSVIDTEIVDTAGGGVAYMLELSQGYFIVAYQVAGIPGRIKTYFISDAGVITDGQISSLDIDLTGFSQVSMVHLQGDIWALCFLNTDQEIMIYTLEIVTPSEAGPHHEMIMKIGP